MTKTHETNDRTVRVGRSEYNVYPLLDMPVQSRRLGIDLIVFVVLGP